MFADHHSYLVSDCPEKLGLAAGQCGMRMRGARCACQKDCQRKWPLPGKREDARRYVFTKAPRLKRCLYDFPLVN